MVRTRYRPATPDEEPYALSDEEVVTRVNDWLFDHELHPAAATLACIMLEPEEGVASHWMPRAEVPAPGEMQSKLPL